MKFPVDVRLYVKNEKIVFKLKLGFPYRFSVNIFWKVETNPFISTFFLKRWNLKFMFLVGIYNIIISDKNIFQTYFKSNFEILMKWIFTYKIIFFLLYKKSIYFLYIVCTFTLSWRVFKSSMPHKVLYLKLSSWMFSIKK